MRSNPVQTLRLTGATLMLASLLGLAGCESDGQADAAIENESLPAVELPEGSTPIAGRYLHLADATLFTGCHTGQRWPVAANEQAAELERRYLSLNSGSESVVATVYARVEELPGMEEGSTVSQLVIDQVVDIPASVPCSFPLSALTGQAWTLASIEGEPVELAEKQKAPDIRFMEDGTVQGFAGCNRFTGNYQADGTSLSFGPLAATRMACKTGDELESRLFGLLDKVTHFDVQDAFLRLQAGGQTLATFKVGE